MAPWAMAAGLDGQGHQVFWVEVVQDATLPHARAMVCASSTKTRKKPAGRADFFQLRVAGCGWLSPRRSGLRADRYEHRRPAPWPWPRRAAVADAAGERSVDLAVMPISCNACTALRNGDRIGRPNMSMNTSCGAAVPPCHAVEHDQSATAFHRQLDVRNMGGWRPI
ncbi:hypothetical protein FQR65_LT20912 [Abscondita terminalis]|nr:hypothetical protein FQR65_LT20912 [Abscondita terminalis]